eukprot:3681968-Rhodomonas_salina.3
MTPRWEVSFEELPDHKTVEELRAALGDAEARASQLQEDARGYLCSLLMASEGTDSKYYSGSRPKLERPWTFEGQYSELVNVLKWLAAVTCYLDPSDVNSSWKEFTEDIVEVILSARPVFCPT